MAEVKLKHLFDILGSVVAANKELPQERDIKKYKLKELREKAKKARYFLQDALGFFDYLEKEDS